jgi:hypothetical protein
MSAGIVFHVGMHVTVQGVVARPELNGRTGVCQSFDHKSGRWTIRFDLDDSLVKLQAEKLRALAQVLQPHARADRPALTLCVRVRLFCYRKHLHATSVVFFSRRMQVECRRYDAKALFMHWDKGVISLSGGHLAFSGTRDKSASLVCAAAAAAAAAAPDSSSCLFLILGCRARAVEQHKGCSHVITIDFLPPKMTEFFAFEERSTRDSFLQVLQVASCGDCVSHVPATR